MALADPATLAAAAVAVAASAAAEIAAATAASISVDVAAVATVGAPKASNTNDLLARRADAGRVTGDSPSGALNAALVLISAE